MAKKEGRQEAVRWIVRNRPVRTQNDLVEELGKLGFTCTQATASRDIADLGLQKRSDGFYMLSEDLKLQKTMSENALGASSVSNFCVVRTPFGSALIMADAMDKAMLDGVIGTIAGKDTVLVICSDEQGASLVSDLVNKHCERECNINF